MSVPPEQEQNPVTLETAAATPSEPVAAEPATPPEPVIAEVEETVVTATAAPAEPEIRVAPKAPLAAPPKPAAPAATDSTAQILEMPLQLLNQLLAKVGATPLTSLAELLPALRLLSLIVVAGVTLKLTGATLGALNELPLLGRLLELVGLISALQFLASNAIKSQKRAELLARIQKLRKDFLG